MRSMSRLLLPPPFRAFFCLFCPQIASLASKESTPEEDVFDHLISFVKEGVDDEDVLQYVQY